MTEKVEKSLTHSHPQTLREHTLWDYYNYWGGIVIFLVQGLHVLQAASAPPCGLSIVVHTTGTETIMTELSWFLFSFGHHCLSQFWSPFLPTHCKIIKSLLYLYFLLLPWLVKYLLFVTFLWNSVIYLSTNYLQYALVSNISLAPHKHPWIK